MYPIIYVFIVILFLFFLILFDYLNNKNEKKRVNNIFSNVESDFVYISRILIKQRDFLDNNFNDNYKIDEVKKNVELLINFVYNNLTYYRNEIYLKKRS